MRKDTIETLYTKYCAASDNDEDKKASKYLGKIQTMLGYDWKQLSEWIAARQSPLTLIKHDFTKSK